MTRGCVEAVRAAAHSLALALEDEEHACAVRGLEFLWPRDARLVDAADRQRFTVPLAVDQLVDSPRDKLPPRRKLVRVSHRPERGEGEIDRLRLLRGIDLHDRLVHAAGMGHRPPVSLDCESQVFYVLGGRIRPFYLPGNHLPPSLELFEFLLDGFLPGVRTLRLSPRGRHCGKADNHSQSKAWH